MRTSLLAAALLATATAWASPPPRTILHGGKVFTADAERPWAEAVAIQGERVVAVGSDEEVLALATPHAHLIDLGGRVVVPGLNDAHVHVLAPQGVYVNSPAFVPGPGPSVDEVAGLLGGAAEQMPAGEWLLGFVGATFADDARADRFTLDEVTPDHPVVLFAWTGHGMWLNTRAMQSLDIAEDEPDPFGGSYERVPGTDIVNGEAHEYAEHHIRRGLYALLSDEAIVAQYRAFAANAVRLGFTSVQDMAFGLTHERAVAVLRAAGLPLRVRSICTPLTLGEPCEASDDGDVRAGGVKWITDGTPVERYAALSAAYQDQPGWFGVFNFAAPALAEMFERGLSGAPAREQLLFHAVGDAAIGRVLDAMEQTGGAAAWRGRRTRVEHGDMLLAGDLDRARDLGVVVVQNATHLALAPVWHARVSPEAMGEIEPMATLLARGIPLALGTDGIGAVGNPFLDLFLATVHPSHPAEALTMEQAVAAYTRGSAFAELEEHRKGTLAPGKLADLAVLSQDIFAPGPVPVPATHSLLTIVGGRVVWDAGAL
jgi:predicted amidohydrolase YtcJ